LKDINRDQIIDIHSKLLISEIGVDTFVGNNNSDFNIANGSADFLKSLTERDEKVLLDLIRVRDKI
jgi:hypothetical protein